MARELPANQLVAMVLQGRRNLIFLNACSRYLLSLLRFVAITESPSLELRLALLHEGLTALAKIRAVHAGRADRPDRVHVAPAFVLQHLSNGELGGLDRERRILRDRLGDAHGLAPELILRNHALDQPDAQRFGGIDAHARVHQEPGPGRSDQRHQVLQAVVAIGNAELRRGNAELATLRGDADVGKHRHLHAAAKTKALDAGNGRLGIIGKQRALGGAYSSEAAALWRVFSNWLMSAPDTKALPPPPRRITTRTVASSRKAVSASPNPSHISSDIALRLSGLLKVITPTPLAVCLRILPSA